MPKGPEFGSPPEGDQRSKREKRAEKEKRQRELLDQGWLDFSAEAERIAQQTGLEVTPIKALTRRLPDRETKIETLLGVGIMIHPDMIPEWERLAVAMQKGRERLQEAAEKGWKKTEDLVKAWSEKYLLDADRIYHIVTHFSKPATDYASQKNSGSRMSPELATQIEAQVEGLAKTRGGPERQDWLSSRTEYARLAAQYNLTQDLVTRQAHYLGQKYPNEYLGGSGGKEEVKFSPAFLTILKDRLAEAGKSLKLLEEADKKGWSTSTESLEALKNEYDLTINSIKTLLSTFRKRNPQLKDEYIATTFGNRMSPEFYNLFRAEVSKMAEKYKRVRESKEKGYKELEPIRVQLAQTTGLNMDQIRAVESNLKLKRDDYITLKDRSIASQEFIAAFEVAATDFKRREQEAGNVPEGWLVPVDVAILSGRQHKFIAKQIDAQRKAHPEWFKEYVDKARRPREYCSPEFVTWILELERERKGAEEQAVLTDQLTEFIRETAEGTEKVEPEHFKMLLDLFGHANAVDVLYKFHPEYKKLPIGTVKSILADYLGDFLVSKPMLGTLEKINYGLDFLEDANFQDHLFEVLKNDIISHYNVARREDATAQYIVASYLGKFREKVSQTENANLEAIYTRLEQYYRSMFAALDKPSHIIDTFRENRKFPDFYQSINIQEVKDKKRMLLADEMGLGKSASAILAKEYLGLKQALVIVPSNVVDTWANYLSDKQDADGTQLGYFKPGEAPRVLIVEDIHSLRTMDKSGYDYVLISQEKLTQKYAQELAKSDFDMLIIDEAHKLKNIASGVRATTVLELAKRIEGPDKYLALLSGTPVPNKVQDIAIILKLLYPEEFGRMKDKELVRNIIYSDIIDLRSKLLPRMQMKELAEGVDMPKLELRMQNLNLSETEQLIYEVLLEEDELEGVDKMRILRQFILNPDLLDATPGILSTKIREVGQRLQDLFRHKDKVVMFVNDYVNNIIQGEKAITPKLGLPAMVEVRVISGPVSKADRRAIQNELKVPNKKILLLVSAKTADVGVDFSGGDHVAFYNEPWTKYDERQQLHRVYRPGLPHDLEADIFVTKDTIEEGMHFYIEAKERAIEKLLRGVPRTEIENRLLEQDEKQARSKGLDVNPELAQYYFSNWDKMTKIFRYVKQIGEQGFKEFLSKFGKDYADCYLNLGNRSYQANAARISGTIIDQMVKEDNQRPQDLTVLDIASGPEMLKRHIPEAYQSSVISIDINIEHFKNPGETAEEQSEKPEEDGESSLGAEVLLESQKNVELENSTQESEDAPSATPTHNRIDRIVGSFLKLPLAAESVDYANFALAFHYTQLIPSRNNYERLEALAELSRVIKPKGKVVLNLIYSLDFADDAKFAQVIQALGFRIVDNYSGHVSVGNNYRSRIITMEKVDSPIENKYDIRDVVDMIGAEDIKGLKFTEKGGGLKDSRKIIDRFALGKQEFSVDFNSTDKELHEEEQLVIERGEQLKAQYRGIEHIPAEEIIENKFTRILIKNKYILFKKLERGEGVVVVK